MARQVGTVLGVAGLVAVLAHVDPSDPVPTYRHGVLLVVLFFVAAGVVSSLLLTGRVDRSAGSAPVGRADGTAPLVAQTAPLTG
jgi:hypothetical protein